MRSVFFFCRVTYIMTYRQAGLLVAYRTRSSHYSTTAVKTAYVWTVHGAHSRARWLYIRCWMCNKAPAGELWAFISHAARELRMTPAKFRSIKSYDAWNFYLLLLLLLLYDLLQYNLSRLVRFLFLITFCEIWFFCAGSRSQPVEWATGSSKQYRERRTEMFFLFSWGIELCCTTHMHSNFAVRTHKQPTTVSPNIKARRDVYTYVAPNEQTTQQQCSIIVQQQQYYSSSRSSTRTSSSSYPRSVALKRYDMVISIRG